ncbi:MAG: ATP-binding cassette domain-containing protein [Ruminococcus sp.]|nr:ATP-binding cassette domain-containing protein [Ruminococcus sp.]
MIVNKLGLQKINKHYGKKKHALCDFSFEFTNGIYGLLGPNGAGKSTLMNIITDNLLPDKDGGKIFWNGEETRLLKDKFRSRLGFMPQQQNLYESMTARTFLNYIAALKCLDKKSAEKMISEIVERVELTDSIDKKMGGFSGGMKQRVLIAAALLGDPELIILDEPTAGLDPKQRVIIRNMVSDLGRDKIIIISTHIVSDIETIAKEILFIKEGRLIDSGTMPELIEKVESADKTLENLYMQYYGEVQS